MPDTTNAPHPIDLAVRLRGFLHRAADEFEPLDRGVNRYGTITDEIRYAAYTANALLWFFLFEVHRAGLTEHLLTFISAEPEVSPTRRLLLLADRARPLGYPDYTDVHDYPEEEAIEHPIRAETRQASDDLQHFLEALFNGDPDVLNAVRADFVRVCDRAIEAATLRATMPVVEAGATVEAISPRSGGPFTVSASTGPTNLGTWSQPEQDWAATALSLLTRTVPTPGISRLYKLLRERGYPGSRPSVYNLPGVRAAAEALGVYSRKERAQYPVRGNKKKGEVEAFRDDRDLA